MSAAHAKTLSDIPGYEHVLIHRGNTDGKVIDARSRFPHLAKIIAASGDDLWLGTVRALVLGIVRPAEIMLDVEECALYRREVLDGIGTYFDLRSCGPILQLAAYWDAGATDLPSWANLRRFSHD